MPIGTQRKKNGDDEFRFQDYSKRILELYDDRSRNFWRSFWVVIALGIFFFFVILLPFVMLQEQYYEIDLQLNQTNTSITNANGNITTYKEIESKIGSLIDATSGGADDLLNYINNLSRLYDSVTESQNMTAAPALAAAQQAASPSEQINDLGYPACIDSAGDNQSDKKDNWMNCNVLKQLRVQFNNFNYNFNQVIPSLLEKVKDDSVKEQIANMIVELSNTSNYFNSTFSKQIEEQPSFWRMYTSKSDFYEKLDANITSFREKYSPNITANLEARQTNLSKTIVELEDLKNITKSNKEELSNRLKGIQSPFGPIPMGVNESVGIFPIALASGFAIYCYFLCSSIQLRKALYELYKKPNSDINAELKKKISLAAPLWIDPTQSNTQNIIRLAILFVPLALFVISWYLILFGLTKTLYIDMRTTFPYDVELYKQLYQGLYTFSLILFGYGIFRVISEWYHYNHKNQFV